MSYNRSPTWYDSSPSDSEEYIIPSAFGQPVRNYYTPPVQQRNMLLRVLNAYRTECNLCDTELKTEEDVVRCSQCSYVLCNLCFYNLYGERKCPGCRKVYHYENIARTPPPSPLSYSPPNIDPLPFYISETIEEERQRQRERIRQQREHDRQREIDRQRAQFREIDRDRRQRQQPRDLRDIRYEQVIEPDSDSDGMYDYSTPYY